MTSTSESMELKELYKNMDYSAEYSGNLPAILKQLNISLAVTSYQAGRLMLVRSDGEQLDVNFKSFPRPMGLTIHNDSLIMGVFTQVIRFQREDGLLAQIKQPLTRIEDDATAPRVADNSVADGWNGQELGSSAAWQLALSEAETEQEFAHRQQQLEQWQRYQESLYEPLDERTDACFITRSSHYSGMINIHDIAWGNQGLWAVNSSFSCLCTLQPDASFVPRWKPPFISELMPEDRCHLNGMALKEGEPAFVTSFSQQDQATNWRQNSGGFEGTLMDVQRNEILLTELCMPHSPRWYRDRLYFCESGLGQICYFDPTTGNKVQFAAVPGFTRGMAFHGPLMFVGLSKIRKGDVTRPAPLAEQVAETESGIWVFNLEDQSLVATLRFSGTVDQIYDVAVIPGCSFPEIIEPTHPRMRNHFCVADWAPLN